MIKPSGNGDLAQTVRSLAGLLNPTPGSKIRKMRPCLVVSPDELNRNIQTAIVAPMTTATRPYPTRVSAKFEGKNNEIVSI